MFFTLLLFHAFKHWRIFLCKKREGAQTISNFLFVFIFYIARYVIWGKSLNFSMSQVFICCNKMFPWTIKLFSVLNSMLLKNNQVVGICDKISSVCMPGCVYVSTHTSIWLLKLRYDLHTIKFTFKVNSSMDFSVLSRWCTITTS